MGVTAIGFGTRRRHWASQDYTTNCHQIQRTSAADTALLLSQGVLTALTASPKIPAVCTGVPIDKVLSSIPRQSEMDIPAISSEVA